VAPSKSIIKERVKVKGEVSKSHKPLSSRSISTLFCHREHPGSVVVYSIHSGFETKILYVLIVFPMRATCIKILFFILKYP
jgi:hypothetical protein